MFTPRKGYEKPENTGDGPNIVKMKCPFTGKEFDIDMNNLKQSIANAHKEEAEKKMKQQEEKMKEAETQKLKVLQKQQEENGTSGSKEQTQQQKQNDEGEKEKNKEKEGTGEIEKNLKDMKLLQQQEEEEVIDAEEHNVRAPEFLNILMHIGDQEQQITYVHRTMTMDYILQSLWDDGPYPLLKESEDATAAVLRPMSTLESIHKSGDTVHLYAFPQE
eukprot:m.59431 g.59431  ORF g.59431 m.59431 type:complete len:218 (+) comp11319_c0_seq6:54-707(+)